MTELLDLIDAGTAIRTPEETHYYELAEAFTATVEELGEDKLSKQKRTALKAKLASQYYALTACPMHALHPSMHYVYETVVKSWGISREPPISKEGQKAARAKYETEYLRETELNLIEAENALRMPRLAKRRRKLLEDDVTFYGAELVCHERNFEGLARRRICTRLIEEHKIDRAAPLEYHFK